MLKEKKVTVYSYHMSRFKWQEFVSLFSRWVNCEDFQNKKIGGLNLINSWSVEGLEDLKNIFNNAIESHLYQTELAHKAVESFDAAYDQKAILLRVLQEKIQSLLDDRDRFDELTS